MAGRGRKALNEALLIAELAAGRSVSSLATLLNCNERTIRRRLEDREFRAQVESAREALVDQVLGQSAALSLSSLARMEGLLNATGEKGEAVRLGAAKAILDALFRGLDQAQARRLAELERRIAELEREPHDDDHPDAGATPGETGGAPPGSGPAATTVDPGPAAPGPLPDTQSGGDGTRSMASGADDWLL